MKLITFKKITNKDLTFLELNQIIKLKKQYWNYSEESQKKWIRKNLKNNDYHLVIYFNSNVVAYANIVHIKYSDGKYKKLALGLGNFCVSKKYASRGLGTLLLGFIRYLYKRKSINVFLLCKTELVKFYTKNHFILFKGELLMNFKPFDHNLLSMKEISEQTLYLTQNF